MTKKKALGKGLGALLSNKSIENIIEDEGKNKIEYLSLSKVIPNKDQPRKDFSEESLKSLSKSIKEYGVIQPIIVREKAGKFQIVAGERRYRASKLAELEEIPAIIMDLDDFKVDKISLIENIQREDLSLEEEALAYQRLIEEHGLTQKELASELSKSRSYISNTLRLLKLDKEILNLIEEGKLTRGHARALLSYEEDERLDLARKIIEEDLSVREVEKEASEKNSKKTSKKSKRDKKEDKDIFLLDLEEKLVEKFDTKVSIKDRNNKGRIEIEYYNLDNLNQILDKLLD